MKAGCTTGTLALAAGRLETYSILRLPPVVIADPVVAATGPRARSTSSQPVGHGGLFPTGGVPAETSGFGGVPRCQPAAWDAFTLLLGPSTRLLKPSHGPVDSLSVTNVGVRSDAAAQIVPRTHDRDAAIQRILRAAREHLGLDIAFVSQFMDGERVFRYVDSEAGVSCVEVGASDPLEESYCHYVVDGSLPEFLPDPAQHPVSARLAVTAALGVGTHLSVPIRFSDGRIYGTFCCFGLNLITAVPPADLRAVQMLAELVSEYLEVVDVEERDRRRRYERIAQVLDDPSGITMVFQPLVELATERIVAVEALARFPTVGEGPEWVFSEAWTAGLGVELEMKAVRAALAHLDQLPEHVRLGVNVSPLTLMSTEFHEAVKPVPAGRLAVEVTEHAAVDDYGALRGVRQQLSALGIRLAIDDVGMGFSGLNHILESGPDTIKIDRAVIRNVHDHPAKAAMIEALVSFGNCVGVLVVAEGIETADELATLRSLGVTVGQGYYLGRPHALAAVIG